jgi:hypothetical protein
VVRKPGQVDPGRLHAWYASHTRFRIGSFGPLPPEAQDRIHQATLPQLETWLDRIIDAPTWQAVFDEH